MIVSLFLLIVLFFAAFRGGRRGLALQTVHTIGYLIVFLVAQMNYAKLIDKLELLVPFLQPSLGAKMLYYSGEQLFDLDRFYYAGISFLLLLLIGWALVKFIGFFFYELTFWNILGKKGTLLASLLAVCVTLVTLCCILNVVAMIPLDIVQNNIQKSFLARMIIEHTPYVSAKVRELWTGIG